MRSALITLESRWAITSVVRFSISLSSGGLDDGLVLSVHAGKRLVQQQDRRVLEQGPSR